MTMRGLWKSPFFYLAASVLLLLLGFAMSVGSAIGRESADKRRENAEKELAACNGLSDTVRLTWNPPTPFDLIFDPQCDRLSKTPSRAHGITAAQARIDGERRWSALLLAGIIVGILAILSSPVTFAMHLRRESRIPHWHYGKLLVLWGLDLLLFLGLWAANGAELQVAFNISIVPTLALAAVTWKWFSGRERTRTP